MSLVWTVLWNGRAVATCFSTDVAASIAAADMVFISVNTTKTKGLGRQASDLALKPVPERWLMATGHTIIVEKSTLPVHGCRDQDNLGSGL